MHIGLWDMDSNGKFPNLPLMKISAWHKAKGDTTEQFLPLNKYDTVYVSKVFSNEYYPEKNIYINAKNVVFGGTGFAITVENGKEIYHKELDTELANEIEHIYPDYSLYSDLTKDVAYGFLTRGCCNNCSFCIVSKKEGRCSVKVADLNEFWKGQKNIKLLDPNILACKDSLELLQQLADSNAWVDFTQGLDARFINEKNIEVLKRIKKKMVHFAFDFMKNEKAIISGLRLYKENIKCNEHNTTVYMLVNYDTTIQQDLYRVNKIKELGLKPDVRIYRKNALPKGHNFYRDLQRWTNNSILYFSSEFLDYVPRIDGKTIKELYF